MASLDEPSRPERRPPADVRLGRLESITGAALAHLTHDDLLDELLTRLRQLLDADTAAVLLADEQHNEVVAHAAQGLEAEVEAGARIPLRRGFAGRIAAEARAIAIPDIDDADVVNPILRQRGVRSLLGVPLLVAGRVIGVLHVGTLHRRDFTDDDAELLQLAADRIALAIDHARLFDSERRARAAAERAAARIRQIESLSEVALAHLALDRDLLTVLLRRVREILGSDTATVLVLNEAGDALEPIAAPGVEEEVGRGIRVPLGAGFAGRVAATRAPLIVDDVGPDTVFNPILRASGVRSLLGVPLMSGDRLLGVIHVGSRVERRFGDDDVTLLELAAQRIAIGLDHSNLYVRERRIAETLQRSLLPERLPSVDRLELGVRYLPGSSESDIGGDWYDAIPLSGGQVAVAMGDVVSRGVHAASVMGQLRNALRAYALDGDSPAALLERLDRVVQTLPDREMATLVYLVVDPVTRGFTLANAGHPPPLVIDAEGRVERLEGGRSTPLGTVSQPIYNELAGVLPAGATLLLYTDGLVESRAVSLDRGLERLEAHGPALAADDLEHGLDSLLETLTPASGAGDDVAVLAVRTPLRGGEALSLTLPADPDALAPLRRSLRHWLEGTAATPEQAYDIVVAASEAAANAIEHAYGPVDATFLVEASVEGDELSLVVRDSGQWRPPRGQNRGRGTLLMQELTDGFEVRTGDDGTEVRLRLRLGARQPVVAVGEGA